MAKILVADDSAFMRTILMDILKEGGYADIIEGETGIEAVEKFDSEKPDLVLMDIVMPELSGIEALKQIMTADANAKIVVITAAGSEAKRAEATKSGARHFIAKPFKKEDVLETVNKLVGGA